METAVMMCIAIVSHAGMKSLLAMAIRAGKPEKELVRGTVFRQMIGCVTDVDVT